MKVEVQARDIQVMKFVFACRAVTYDQILRRHFPKTHKVVAWRRIRRLAIDGYFKVSVLEIRGRAVRVVQPLPKMWPLIIKKWPFAVEMPHYKSESPEHDVGVAEIFLRFEKLKCFRSFFTENLLQSSITLAEDPRFKETAKLQSDGALVISDPKGEQRVYALEYELSKKSPDRYRQKFIDYYLARGIDGVLYISSEREVASLIARIDEEISQDRDSIVRFCFELSALSANPKMIFSTRERANLELV